MSSIYVDCGRTGAAEPGSEAQIGSSFLDCGCTEPCLNTADNCHIREAAEEDRWAEKEAEEAEERRQQRLLQESYELHLQEEEEAMREIQLAELEDNYMRAHLEAVEEMARE
ncbi:uncharacterized protein LOC117650698 [Thrips palmi]|uniref:Uncharacterized protein LOC117650698 n=1 Tax=Thrips palmi TaxID=161013 RepID=A0A6P8ZYJ2_THRPL|nr:uncharacterized protein LOC117650698 [Thrips palmi]